jgi:hypothetical protein
VMQTARNQDFRTLPENANSIFDSQEPIGAPTDLVFQPKSKKVGQTTAANPIK